MTRAGFAGSPPGEVVRTVRNSPSKVGYSRCEAFPARETHLRLGVQGFNRGSVRSIRGAPGLTLATPSPVCLLSPTPTPKSQTDPPEPKMNRKMQSL